MNATIRALSAYGNENRAVRTERGIEFEVFSRVTRALARASDNVETHFSSLVEALHLNRRLWIALAADVSASENQLGDTLRAQIFYLSEFVGIHTSEVLKGNAQAAALIDINVAIMRGLDATETNS